MVALDAKNIRNNARLIERQVETYSMENNNQKIGERI